ncbi:hypothetical protein BAE44_0021928, partial [Dichanthelium oligosanthes]
LLLCRRIVRFPLPLLQGPLQFAQRWTHRWRRPCRPHERPSRRRKGRRLLGRMRGGRARHVPRARRERGHLELHRRRRRDLWLGQCAPGRLRRYVLRAPRRRNGSGSGGR